MFAIKIDTGNAPKGGIEQALALHRSGNRDLAAEAYRSILAADPRHADALHLLGLLASEEGRHAEAAARIREAVALRPQTAVYWSNLGLALGRQGEHDEAVAAYRRSIELDPTNAKSRAKLGRALTRRGKTDEAVRTLAEAVNLDGGNPDTWNAYGAALAEIKRIEEATAAFRRAVQLDGSFAEAYQNLGHGLRLQGKLAEAASSYRCAWQMEPGNAIALDGLKDTLREWGDGELLKQRPAAAVRAYLQLADLAPGDPDVHFRLGLSLTAEKRLPDACRHYEESLRLRPEHPETLNNLAHVVLALGDAGRSLDLLRRALETQPGYADALYNLGVTLQELERHEEAREVYERLIGLYADHADGLNNLGGVALAGRRIPEAMAYYRRAIEAKPGHVDARWNLGLAHLTRGEYAAGWEGYEARLEQANFPRRDLGKPRWTGEPVEGKTLLVWAEQGLGDTIQFARFLPLLGERGCRVVLECQSRLAPLFGGSGWPVSVVAKGDALPEFDYHVPLLSLPGLLETGIETIPSPAGDWKLPAERVERWRQSLAAYEGIRVGLTWGGSPHNFRGRQRSIPFETLSKLGGDGRITLFALQKGPQAEELPQSGNPAGVIALDPPGGDILDTAAIVSQLDLVITVDTMMAHLAGSLGKPVWTLLPYAADWRWMIDRADSPWYPTMRLFRQTRAGEWGPVIEEAGERLGSWIAGFSRDSRTLAAH